MPNAIPHKQEQKSEAASLSAKARSVGMRALSSSTLRLAQLAVEHSMAADSDPTLRDAVLDLKTVRGDREFTLALDGDLAASEDAVAELLLEAIQAGLESEMIAQMAAVQGLTFELTQADLDICAGYPIHGHTPLEMSHDMHGRLRYQVNGVTAAPLIGDAVAESMPQLLGGVVTQFSDACGGAVEEAYYAGTQLAMRMVAHALIGTSDAG